MGACTSKISKRRPSPRESEEDAQSEDNMKTERNESNQSPALDIHMMETPNFGALRIDELLRKLDDRNFYKRNIKRWTIKEFLMGIDLIESRDSLMALATALINKLRRRLVYFVNSKLVRLSDQFYPFIAEFAPTFLEHALNPEENDYFSRESALDLICLLCDINFACQFYKSSKADSSFDQDEDYFTSQIRYFEDLENQYSMKQKEEYKQTKTCTEDYLKQLYQT
eukprot:TRINITY_DN12748_c0_g1_i14.p1 TRINITY_DN12748_c0_g1~~TRINITY_DN12748_c0_g1_i14.p1  ORF type:complete len:226 (+),score=42.39 TRINITY_DN12748_c0_g1_i14:190-867(+)